MKRTSSLILFLISLVVCGCEKEEKVLFVVTAVTDLEPGQVLTLEDMEIKAMPAKTLIEQKYNVRYVALCSVVEGEPQIPGWIDGRRVSAGIKQGEPLLTYKLLPTNRPGLYIYQIFYVTRFESRTAKAYNGLLRIGVLTDTGEHDACLRYDVFHTTKPGRAHLLVIQHWHSKEDYEEHQERESIKRILHEDVFPNVLKVETHVAELVR